jgi:hypothetical protein
MPPDVTLSKSTALTPKSDQTGCAIKICCPTWFDKRESFKIHNAPKYAADLAFSGDDLNFAARVLYAEATGSKVGIDADDLASEKQAILHVMYFRINRKGYPSNKYVAKSFKMVGEAPQVQFESVARATQKFTSTELPSVDNLKAAECGDLQACLDAVRSFAGNGPNFKKYPFDEFRDTKSRPTWTPIAKNAFHLTALGKALLAEMENP